LLKKEKNRAGTVLSPFPELPTIPSDEVFGLVSSKHTETFGGLLAATKYEEDDNEDMFDLAAQDDLDADRVLQQLGVDPALRFQVMLQRPANTTSTMPDSESSHRKQSTNRLLPAGSNALQQTNPSAEERRTDLQGAVIDGEPHAPVIVSLRIISVINIFI